MVEAEEEGRTLEFTSTWVVAVVCFVIVLISFLVHRFLHFTGQLLSRESKRHPSRNRGRRKRLFHALQKIKEELMLLGFISLLLSVFQTSIGKICISERLVSVWLPCHQPTHSSSSTTAHFSTNNVASDGYRRLLAHTTDYCGQKGKVPLLSLTALHDLHIFIFVLATFHAIVCVLIILCGEAKLHYWRQWDKSIRKTGEKINEEDIHSELSRLATKGSHSSDGGKRLAVMGWLQMCGKHFFPSVTKLEYLAIRLNCIKAPNVENRNIDLQTYIIQGQKDFDDVVGISWYMWLFVVLFLLLDVAGWHAYFWISFLPLTLLLVVGAKLEHVVTQKTKKIIEKYDSSAGASTSTITAVEFSDEDFWFHKPHLVLDLIHLILFQNSFQLAFFFFIWLQYDFNSCIMGELGYAVPRLVIGVFVQLMCSYRTLPLYAIMKSQITPKNNHSREEGEMKLVTWIWNCIERDSPKVATGDESTQNGSQVGLASNEQPQAGEIKSEMGADLEAQDRTKPTNTLPPGQQRLVSRPSFASVLSFRGS